MPYGNYGMNQMWRAWSPGTIVYWRGQEGEIVKYNNKTQEYLVDF